MDFERQKTLELALSGSLLFANLTGLRLFLLGKRTPNIKQKLPQPFFLVTLALQITKK